MKTIIIPTDFSNAAANAVDYCVRLAKEINAGIILFHAYQVPLSATEASVMITEATIDKMRQDAEEKLQILGRKIKKELPDGFRVSTEVRVGNTVTELETFCNELKPFAVVMGSTGHSAIGRVLFGSTTLTAIRQLGWPVIAVPPGTVYKAIKKIGLACDLKQAEKSLPVSFIREVANTFHAELHILHVDYRNPRHIPEKNEQLQKMKAIFSDLAPLFHFIERADIEQSINQFAFNNKLDLIITIPKKHSLLDSLFHKSGSKQILFGSKIPVMSIHE